MMNKALKRVNEKNTGLLIEILAVLLLMFVGYLIFLNNPKGLNSMNNSDVHRGFQRGITVLEGGNPYLEFNPEQMLLQEKAPSFFPLYFYLMAFFARVSDYSFVLFIDNLRFLVFTAYVSIGATIYLLLRKQSRLLAFSGMFFFMFNRWTINDILSLKQDTYIIILLLVSLVLLKKNKYASFLILGVATAIKHLTVFALPVFALEILRSFWLNRSNLRSPQMLLELKKSVIYVLLFLFPILAPAIPFMRESPTNFFYSFVYQVTRESESSTALDTGFDKMLILYNQDKNQNIFYFMLPRLPMLAAYLGLVAALFAGKLNKWRYCAFAYLIFIGFNSVLFMQYYVWAMAFLPLVLLEEDRNGKT